MGIHVFDQRERSLIERSPVPVAVYQFIDKRVVPLAISKGFCALFGYGADEVYGLMGTDMYRDTHPDDVGRVADEAIPFATQGADYNIVYRTKVGEDYRVVHAIGEHLTTDNGDWLGVIWYTDEGVYDPGAGEFESGLSQAYNKLLHEETLYKTSYYDSLTGLPNMTSFFEKADLERRRMWQEGLQPAFLYVDFNGMRYFNGKFGFAEGDALLRAFSKVLVSHFGIDNCSRFAQDHFAAIAEATGLEGKLQEMLVECEGINDGNNVPVRVGVYLDRDTSIDISDACDRAKHACEINHEAFRSEYNFFDDSMLANVKWRPYVIGNIDKAIEQRWIKVHYQPIVRAANELVCDEEALARWDDPEHGFLSPADFVPILEDAKLIYKLDLFVVDEVLEKLKKVRELGIHMVPQSVNLSRADFEMCDIVEEIRRRVDESRIPREKLTIEITESVIGSDFEFMKEQVKRFQDLGFHVWMDDFGSGYSSLDVLQEIRFDLIKFDMSFLRRFDEGDESKIILTELVRMAVGLGIDTLAEGVEDPEHVSFLQEVGCNKLQGYYYSKPIPFEEILNRYESGAAIGFEDPRESEYYATIGRINLYDTSVMAQEDTELSQRYFDTLPMAVMEMGDETFTVTRCNKAYRDFMVNSFDIHLGDSKMQYDVNLGDQKSEINIAMRQCAEDGQQLVINETIWNGSTVHSFMKRVAINPVTGVTALVAIVLTVAEGEDSNDNVSYANVAEVLSADYIDLYHVNLDTEHFVQYSSNTSARGLSIERHGEDFFQKSRDDAMVFLHEDDRLFFVEAFTKEKVLQAIEENGTFTLMYRLLVEDGSLFVNMKAVRMHPDSNDVIIGVNNIDAQVKQREALDRAHEERAAYSRLLALMDDYLCIYMVDSKKGRYAEFGAAQNYEGLGLAKQGDDFFEEALRQSERVVLEEDRASFCEQFSREAIMSEIERNGLYVFDYRIVMDGEVQRMRAKAAIAEGDGGSQLVFGIIRRR